MYEDVVIDNLLSRDAYTTQKAEAQIRAELFELTSGRSIWGAIPILCGYGGLPDDAIVDLFDRVNAWPDGHLEVFLRFPDELPASIGVEQ